MECVHKEGSEAITHSDTSLRSGQSSGVLTQGRDWLLMCGLYLRKAIVPFLRGLAEFPKEGNQGKGEHLFKEAREDLLCSEHG